jgi:hypothetical protein
MSGVVGIHPSFLSLSHLKFDGFGIKMLLSIFVIKRQSKSGELHIKDCEGHPAEFMDQMFLIFL